MTYNSRIMESRPRAALSVRTAHLVAVGSALTAGVLLLSQVDVVDFAVLLGLSTLAFAVLGDIYQRFGRFNPFSTRR